MGTVWNITLAQLENYWWYNLMEMIKLAAKFCNPEFKQSNWNNQSHITHALSLNAMTQYQLRRLGID
jgi:hypothetical protein